MFGIPIEIIVVAGILTIIGIAFAIAFVCSLNKEPDQCDNCGIQRGIENAYDKLQGENIRKIQTKHGEVFKCICGCEKFKITFKHNSYLAHCNLCGMFCASRKEQYV